MFQEPKLVIIVIEDANDNIPVFDNASYDRTIPEVSPLQDAWNIFLVCTDCKQFIRIESKLASEHSYTGFVPYKYMYILKALNPFD